MNTETQQAPGEDKSDRLLDVVDAVNVLARIEAVIGAVLALRHKSKKHKNQKRAPGVIEIRVPRDYGGDGHGVMDILKHYGIEVWGGRTNGKHFIMYIKARQSWGIGILRGKGIDVESSTNVKAINVKHAWADGHEPTPAVPLPKPKKPSTKRRQQHQPSTAQRTLSQVKRWF